MYQSEPESDDESEIDTDKEKKGVKWNKEYGKGMQRFREGDLTIIKFWYSPFGPFGAPKSSAFFITINTNKKPVDKMEEVTLIDWLQSALENTFSKENMPKVLTDLETLTEPTLPVLGAVVFKYAVEVGQKPKGGRVHAHSLLTVQHSTKLHVNTNKVKSHMISYFKDNDVKILNLYVNIRAAKTEEAMLRYITKHGGI